MCIRDRCQHDNDCISVWGDCDVGLGGCHYSVNEDNYPEDEIDNLVELWIAGTCMSGVCDCSAEPYAQCINGTCTSAYCMSDNPAGCFQTGCDEGYECVVVPDECVPSWCGCDGFYGDWFCTEDCGGGSCLATGLLGDLNGDGSPEIAVLSRSSSLGAGSDDPPWLKVFQWTVFDFSPSSTITLSGVRDSERLRPSGIALIDFDLDGADEISFAQASPMRALSINSLLGRGELRQTASLMRKRQTVSSSTISAGYGPIHMVEITYNNASAPDLMAISPEIAQVRLQVFTSRGGRLLPGTSALPSYPPGIAPPIGLIPSGIVSLDINDDNADEVLLPFQQGSVLAVQQEGSGYKLVTCLLYTSQSQRDRG